MSLSLFNGVYNRTTLHQISSSKCPPQLLYIAAGSNVGAGNTDLRAKELAVITKTVTVTVFIAY